MSFILDILNLRWFKNFRTFLMLAVIAALGAMVDLQNSCNQNTAELGDLCAYVQHPWTGKAIVALAAVAAWFRKLAGTSK